MVTTRKIAARVSGADTGCATTMVSIYGKSSELAFRRRGPTAPRDFASKLKDSNPIPTRRMCNVDRISEAKFATRLRRAFIRLNHVKQFDEPSDAVSLGKKPSSMISSSLTYFWKIGLQRAR